MNQKRLVNRVEIALFCAVLLVHGVAFLWSAVPSAQSSFAAAVVVDSIVASQAALLTILAVLGPGKWFVRWPFALLGFTGIVVAQSGYRSNYLYSILGYQTTALVFMLLVIKIRGFSIQRQTEQKRQAVQFSMRALLVATGVFAVGLTLAGVGRNLAGDHLRLVGLGGIGLTFAAAAFLSLWLTLRSQNLWLGLALLMPAAPLLGLLPTYLMHRETDWWIFSGWSCGFVAIVASTLALLRMGSWNLVRRESILASPVQRWGHPAKTQNKTESLQDDAEFVMHSANGLAEVKYEFD